MSKKLYFLAVAMLLVLLASALSACGSTVSTPAITAIPTPTVTHQGGIRMTDEEEEAMKFKPDPIYVGTEKINIIYPKNNPDCSISKNDQGFVITTPGSVFDVRLVTKFDSNLSFQMIPQPLHYSYQETGGMWIEYEIGKDIYDIQCYEISGSLVAEGNIVPAAGDIIAIYLNNMIYAFTQY